MERGDDGGDHGGQEGTDEGDELQDSGDDAKQDRIGHAEDCEDDAAHDADERARQKLRSNVRRQHVVQLVSELPRTQSQTVRQRSQGGAPEAMRILQQKEREDWNQHEPWQVPRPPRQAP